MSLNDYSSIFELLCGYNFVNAINKKEVLNFLDFTTPVKDEINKVRQTIDEKFDALLGRPGTSLSAREDMRAIVNCQMRAERIDEILYHHEKQSSNLYLIGGVFCFFILFFSGMEQDYPKANSIFLMLFATIGLFALFLKCDHAKPNKQLKWGLVVSFIGIIVLIVLCKIFCPVFIFRDGVSLALAIQAILFIVLILKRWFVIRRKTHKVAFMAAWYLAIFIPHSDILHDTFYFSNGTTQVANSAWMITTVGLCIFFALIPFVYDLYIHVRYEKEIKQIAEIVTKIESKTDIVGPGMTGTITDFDPFRPNASW